MWLSGGLAGRLNYIKFLLFLFLTPRPTPKLRRGPRGCVCVCVFVCVCVCAVGGCLCCAYECVNMSVVKTIGRCINCKILQSMLIPVLPLVCNNKNNYIYIYKLYKKET